MPAVNSRYPPSSLGLETEPPPWHGGLETCTARIAGELRSGPAAAKAVHERSRVPTWKNPRRLGLPAAAVAAAAAVRWVGRRLRGIDDG